MLAKYLYNSIEIAQYIKDTSSAPIDFEFIEECFFDCYAVLKEVSIVSLIVENENNHIVNRKKESKYFSLPLETMPPLVIRNHKIIDGHHRFRILKYLGVEKFIVYEIL